MPLRALHLSTSLLVAISCTSGDPAQPDCLDGRCDSTFDQPIAGGTLATCSFTTVDSVDLVECRTGDSQVVTTHVLTLIITDRDGAVIDSAVAAPGETVSTPIVAHERYPLTATARVDIEAADSAIPFQTLIRTFELEAPGEEFTIVAPFEFWPVQLATPDFAFFEGELRTLGEAEATIDLESTFVEAAQDLPGFALIPVEAGAQEVTGTLHGTSTSEAASFVGPGRYVGSDAGLRPATDGDAELFASAPSIGELLSPESCFFDYLPWLEELGSTLGTDGAAAHLESLKCVPADADAYSTWHQMFSEATDASIAAQSDAEAFTSSLTVLDSLLAARPDGPTSGNYQTFLSTLVLRIDAMRSDALSGEETQILSRIVRAAPHAGGEWSHSEEVSSAAATSLVVHEPGGYVVRVGDESKTVPATFELPATNETYTLAISADNGDSNTREINVTGGTQTDVRITHAPRAIIADDAENLEAQNAWVAAFDTMSTTAFADAEASDDEMLALVALAGVSPAAPSRSDEAYRAWHSAYANHLPQFETDNDNAIAVMERLESVRPGARGFDAYNAWFANYVERFSSFVPTASDSLDAADQATLDRMMASTPHSMNVAGYQAWLDFYAERFGEVGAIDAISNVWLVQLERARPCVLDAASAQAALEAKALSLQANRDVFTAKAFVEVCE